MRYAETWTDARLRAVRDLTPSIREFEIVPDDDVPAAYPLGAHITVEVQAAGKPDTRCYSLTGAEGCYRIAVKHDPDGMTYLGLPQRMLQVRAAGEIELTLDLNDICIAILRCARPSTCAPPR